MKIYCEMSLENFDAWGGAEDTLNRVIEEDKCRLLEAIFEDIYPDGIGETELNDILRFDSEWVYESCGIPTARELEEELEEVLDEMNDMKDEFESAIEDFEFSEDGIRDSTEYWNIHYRDEYKELERKAEDLKYELRNM